MLYGVSPCGSGQGGADARAAALAEVSEELMLAALAEVGEELMQAT